MSKKTKQAAAKGRRKAEEKAKVADSTPVEAVGLGDFDTTAPEGEAKPKAAKKERKEGALPPLPKMPSAARARKPRPKVACTCGCGGQTSGLWVPGHDARAKGYAIRIERDMMKLSDVPANERAGAEFMLKERKAEGTTGKITLAKGKKQEKEAKDAAEKEAVNQ